MYKDITLMEFVNCLSFYLKEHGDKRIRSIGAWSGEVEGLMAPISLHLYEGDDMCNKRGEIDLVLPAFEHDVQKFINKKQEENKKA